MEQYAVSPRTVNPIIVLATALAILMASFVALNVGHESQAGAAEYYGVTAPAYGRMATQLRYWGADNATVIKYVNRGVKLRIWCWYDAGWSHGTNRWFSVNTFDTWTYGEISANDVGNQPPNVPRC